MRFISLFSGVGGIDLGLERSGWRCVAQVENNAYALAVLRRHWPSVPKWEDVHNVRPEELPNADAVVGGFPCQPFSVAGKRRGAGDPRNLWPEMRRIVAGVRPRWVLAENVAGIINTYLDAVADDLETLGYTVGAFTLPAAAFGAPHLRERLFIIAYTDITGQHREGVSILPKGGRQPWRDADTGRSGAPVPHTKGFGCPRWADLPPASVQEWLARLERDNPWAAEPGMGRVAHGVPNRVDRVRALGNAVVPQVAEFIGRLILEVDAMHRGSRALQRQ